MVVSGIGRSITPGRRKLRAAIERLDRRVMLAGDLFVTVLHDANGNGNKDADEPPLTGWTVFVDYDRDEVLDVGEPSALTDIDGEAFIFGIPDGTWDVVQQPQPGWGPSIGYSTVDRIRIRANETTEVEFLNVPLGNGSIQGTLWNDVNGNGVRDPGDNGMQGFTVFADLNKDNLLNVGEPSDVTDANGFYSLGSFVVGQYDVREILTGAWDPTVGFDNERTVNVTLPGPTIVDFGNFNVDSIGSLGGVVWNDVNADTFRAAGDPGLEGWTVYLDDNANNTRDVGEIFTTTDPAGGFLFSGVLVGTRRVAVEVQSGWSASRPTAINVTVNSEDVPNVQFSVYTPTLGTVTGVVWNDIDGNGVINGGEAGLADWTIYIDSNGNAAPDVGEPTAVTDAVGSYALTGVPIGANTVREVVKPTFTATAPGTGMQQVTVLNGSTVANINFGNKQRADAEIGGTAFVDYNLDGVRGPGERGLAGLTVYLDLNNNGDLDIGEPSTVTSADLFFTPTVNEAGNYSFSHLPAGTYKVREVVPVLLSKTLEEARSKTIVLAAGELRTGVDFANQFRDNEMHGHKYNDLNGNHTRDAGEPGIGGVTIYLDLDRDNVLDATEPRTTTATDGSYAFVTDLSPDSYIVREVLPWGWQQTYPTTTGGILWPAGTSHAAFGNVSPTSITTVLARNETHNDVVSLTLPTTGSISNMVDVFLLFDDTGSFTANSPIVRAAFPQIISTLQAAMPGVDFGFGVGRFEEYANFGAESPVGRPFILNQPIISSSVAGFQGSIQSALDRTAPGYGGDMPETVFEALWQTATGIGFDGNNNGTMTDSGAAGQVSTQLNPGNSGDVPSFSSFAIDPAGNVLPASGNVGGAGFRPGALPIILTATDTGFAFQPAGETVISGANGLTLPVSDLTSSGRASSPFSSGATIQQTVTALNALGALVIGLGTNGAATTAPRQGLEALAKLTGAINQSTGTIANGTLDPIAPGDPLYFQIASGFGPSVTNGIVAAIQNAVANVSVNLTLKASDPRVQLSSAPGVINNVSAGETATFNITFTGDGRPHRFDLQFVREGTNVVLGSIPVVIGTPVPGDGYEYEDLDEGEIDDTVDFGNTIDPAAVLGVSSQFERETRQAVVVQFDHDVLAGLEASDFVVTHLGTSTAVPTTMSYDSTTMRATLTFSGILNDGDYQLSIAAGAITALRTPHTLNFAVLAGDANNDRSVGFADLVALAQNYGQLGRTYSQGNLDYSADGRVSFSDLLILAQHYNNALPASIGSRPTKPRRSASNDVLN